MKVELRVAGSDIQDSDIVILDTKAKTMITYYGGYTCPPEEYCQEDVNVRAELKKLRSNGYISREAYLRWVEQVGIENLI